MINKKIWLATCLAAACGFTASAVAQDTQSSQSQVNKSITVTGCLERDTQAPVGTSGSTAANTAESNQFKLTSVTSSPSSSTTASTAGTTGTSGSTSAEAASASEYRLDGDSSTLSPHVGEKVEITGTVENGSSSTSGYTGSTASSSSSSSSMSSSAANGAERLRVDHVKMIAASCR